MDNKKNEVTNELASLDMIFNKANTMIEDLMNTYFSCPEPDGVAPVQLHVSEKDGDYREFQEQIIERLRGINDLDSLIKINTLVNVRLDWLGKKVVE